jgi:hypothetical protein
MVILDGSVNGLAREILFFGEKLSPTDFSAFPFRNRPSETRNWVALPAVASEAHQNPHHKPRLWLRRGSPRQGLIAAPINHARQSMTNLKSGCGRQPTPQQLLANSAKRMSYLISGNVLLPKKPATERTA